MNRRSFFSALGTALAAPVAVSALDSIPACASCGARQIRVRGTQLVCSYCASARQPIAPMRRGEEYGSDERLSIVSTPRAIKEWAFAFVGALPESCRYDRRFKDEPHGPWHAGPSPIYIARYLTESDTLAHVRALAWGMAYEARLSKIATFIDLPVVFDGLGCERVRSERLGFAGRMALSQYTSRDGAFSVQFAVQGFRS